MATCLSVAKKLNDLREKYKDAPVVVVSICSESNVILACLSQMQMLLLQKKTLADLPPELPAVLDQAVTGCTMVFSCLELEMQRMDSGTSESARLPWKARFRFIWNETKLNELLGALRGQQALKALGDIKYMLDKQKDTVQTSARITQSLRSKNPSVRVASSIYGGRARETLGHTYDVVSMVAPSELEFEFDDLVVNSQVYRRTLALAQAQTRATVDGGRASSSSTFEGPMERGGPDVTKTRLLSGLNRVGLPSDPISPVQSSEGAQKAKHSSGFAGLPLIREVPGQHETSDAAQKTQRVQRRSRFLMPDVVEIPAGMQRLRSAIAQAEKAQAENSRTTRQALHSDPPNNLPSRTGL
ncbi:hypothetical protein QBC37DRAFT_466036 [Rhypophila decipiens]|uniref:Uncharacterized protein n=1 Tax=Rhypophila decipiens TaxID=261697 RepID=A0AAN6YA97_9PEZI|nr:hypothetical protein QBC37DRAFT_466036 [Rhypophila decipiens]